MSEAPDELVFMMGKYAAHLPTDRVYVESHLWLQRVGEIYRVGFTAYSVRLLQDVYFLSWSIDPETTVRKKQELGEIESSKALSTLYAPRNGRIRQFNEQLLNDPSAINTDNYGTGWLFEFETDEPLLTPQEYLKVLEGGWDATQRMIKGQFNDAD
jgi:glycine cleavage system H protein